MKRINTKNLQKFVAKLPDPKALSLLAITILLGVIIYIVILLLSI